MTTPDPQPGPAPITPTSSSGFSNVPTSKQTSVGTATPSPAPGASPTAPGSSGGVGSSSGTGSGAAGGGPVTGPSLPGSADPSAATGNIITDFGDFLHGILSDIPGGNVLAEGFAIWGDFSHAFAVPIAHFLNAFKPGQGYRILFYALTLVTGVSTYAAFGGKLPNRPSHSDNLPLGMLMAGATLMFGFMAFRPWPSINGSPIKPGAYLWDELHGSPPPKGQEGVSAAEIQVIEGSMDILVGMWLVQKFADSFKDLAEGAYDVKQSIFGWWGDLF
jgi:hypothetical protein